MCELWLHSVLSTAHIKDSNSCALRQLYIISLSAICSRITVLKPINLEDITKQNGTTSVVGVYNNVWSTFTDRKSPDRNKRKAKSELHLNL